jgi:hypothetical protein
LLRSLYRDHDLFVAMWRGARNLAVGAGFVLGVDARLVNAAAVASTIPN